MQNAGPNKNSDKNTKNKKASRNDTKERNSNGKARKRKIVIYGALFLISSTICGTVYFLNHAITLLCILCLFVAALFLALATRLELIDAGSRSGIASAWFSIICFPTGILCIYLVYIETRPLSLPEVSVNLTTSHAPKHSLQLKIPSLLISGANVTFPSDTPVLAVAIFSTEQGVTCRFQFHNDSTNEISGAEEMFLMLPKDAAFQLENGWEEYIAQESTTGKPVPMRLFRHKRNEIMLPDDTIVPPDIAFAAAQPRSQRYGDRIPVIVGFRAKGVPRFSVRFFLVIVRMEAGMNDMILPQIIPHALATRTNDGYLVPLKAAPIETN